MHSSRRPEVDVVEFVPHDAARFQGFQPWWWVSGCQCLTRYHNQLSLGKTTLALSFPNPAQRHQ